MRSMKSAILNIQSTTSLIPLPLTTCSRVPLLRCRYGAHLSKEEVAPHPDTLELVNSWLEHHGVPSSSISTTHGGSWLTVTGVPVSQVNKLLGASYRLYQQARTNDTAILRTVGYGLPTMLHTHMQTVAPTTYFASTRTVTPPQTSRRRSVGAAPVLQRVESREFVTVLSSRGPSITPSYLRWLYRTYPLPRLAGMCSGLRDTIAVPEPGRPDDVHGRMSR